MKLKFQLKFSENKQKVIENMPKQMMQESVLIMDCCIRSKLCVSEDKETLWQSTNSEPSKNPFNDLN